MTTVYIWAGIAIIILVLVVRLVRWFKLPAIQKEKTTRWLAWLDFRKWRIEFRRKPKPDNDTTPQPQKSGILKRIITKWRKRRG